MLENVLPDNVFNVINHKVSVRGQNHGISGIVCDGRRGCKGSRRHRRKRYQRQQRHHQGQRSFHRKLFEIITSDIEPKNRNSQ